MLIPHTEDSVRLSLCCDYGACLYESGSRKTCTFDSHITMLLFISKEILVRHLKRINNFCIFFFFFFFELVVKF